MRKTTRKSTIIVLAMLPALLTGAGDVFAQVGCDSLYFLLQNLIVNHIRAKEVLVDQFMDCPVSDTLGGFILTRFGSEGEKDRAVIARLGGRGWQYCFGERGRNIRFKKPAPRIDIDGDGGLDLVFIVSDKLHPTERGYQIVFVDNNKERPMKGLRFPDGMIIDSILSAPDGHPRPLQVADRRGWTIGGLSKKNKPISYRYMAWDGTADPPEYVNRTAANLHLFPAMLRRAAYIKALPKSGDLEYEAAEEYEDFLTNVIGYCMDQSNFEREAQGYEEIEKILDRVRYKGSTVILDSPREVRQGLRRALPEARRTTSQSQKKRSTTNKKK